MQITTCMSSSPQSLVSRAIARDKAALVELVREVMPTVRARVRSAVASSRSVRAQGRSFTQEVDDMAQEVFVSLFADNAKTLRSWDPARGASLSTFIGLIAEHQVYAILRSAQKRPWRDDHTSDADLEHVPMAGRTDPEMRAASRELVVRLFAELRRELTPKGLELFQALIVEEKPIDQVCRETGLSQDSVYAWRSRLRRQVQKLAERLEQESCRTMS